MNWQSGLRIGIDVGGTNTDAVLMQRRVVRATYKAATSYNVSDGIIRAIETILAQAGEDVSAVQCVMIGTTQFTNAFVERTHLQRVGIIRTALPATKGLPPLLDWPADIKAAVGGHVAMVPGGYQYDGTSNSALDERAIANAARNFKAAGLRSVAITSMFSPVNGDMELRAEEIVRNEIPDAAVTLSHKIGRLGLLERENAAIMNASLADLAKRVVQAFRDALIKLKINAPFYISQNDGTLMSAAHVEKYPVLTFASGPTNSMRGAVYLSGEQDALVADIGGTTTDLGVLTGGFPRESSMTSDIGGVRTNFRMPDILALALGGGSIIRADGKEPLQIGPQSVGYRITEKALIFGGDTLTATDIAVAAGYADIGDRSRVVGLSADVVRDAVALMHGRIAEGIDRMKTSAEPVPLVLVGGGSILVSQELAGISRLIVPDHAAVANAVGASIAQIGGESEGVYSYAVTGRDAAIALAKQDAVKSAIAAGADPDSVEILDIDEVPLAYVPGGAVRLRVNAAGRLRLTADLQAARP
ncbi:hydantoinase/oxoprolinase N-terminal domain-containing protein [Sphingomonas crocodyli]|uniref:Hydantoinase/oxoprolinase family protein n=1 Tax=Sphingomonas crocodyli TaxID=1979270 RepID=A0A437M5Y9_9SPHN|nr:hydantoinase/oxoprolinase family protein [Sphingomonas crocodyli]RVT92975.1 hydantoinase/oxoprolinase family protein [Sphingomonas crocodyli]